MPGMKDYREVTEAATGVIAQVRGMAADWWQNMPWSPRAEVFRGYSMLALEHAACCTADAWHSDVRGCKVGTRVLDETARKTVFFLTTKATSIQEADRAFEKFKNREKKVRPDFSALGWSTALAWELLSLTQRRDRSYRDALSNVAHSNVLALRDIISNDGFGSEESERLEKKKVCCSLAMSAAEAGLAVGLAVDGQLHPGGSPAKLVGIVTGWWEKAMRVLQEEEREAMADIIKQLTWIIHEGRA